MAVRRVRRVIRRIDPWTVLKVSFVFNLIASLVFVLGMWVMWSVAVQRGIPGRISELAATLTVSFTPDGPLYFRVVVLLAVIWAVLMTGLITLGAVLYNLIADLVGGIEVSVLEESYNATVVNTPRRVRPAIHRGNGGTGAATQPQPQLETTPTVEKG